MTITAKNTEISPNSPERKSPGKALQGRSLGFHGLILFLSLFNELQFFVLLGTISQIFSPKYLTDSIP